jgi:hypothetical protein
MMRTVIPPVHIGTTFRKTPCHLFMYLSDKNLVKEASGYSGLVGYHNDLITALIEETNTRT